MDKELEKIFINECYQGILYVIYFVNVDVKVEYFLK
jgi:hypothetical protein